MSLSVSESERYIQVEPKVDKSRPGSLVDDISKLKKDMEEIRRAYPGGERNSNYVEARSAILAQAAKSRKEIIRNREVALRGELIIEGSPGAYIESARTTQGELVIDSTNLLLENLNYDLQSVRRDTELGGPAQAAYGGHNNQKRLPLIKSISVDGQSVAQASAYYTKESSSVDQPFGVEISYSDPSGKTKREFLSSNRKGGYIRKEMGVDGKSTVVQELGEDYDAKNEFERLQNKVQEGIDIRKLGGLAQQEYAILTNQDVSTADYDKLVGSLAEVLEDRKQATIEAIDNMAQSIDAINTPEADTIKAQLKEFLAQAVSEIDVRKGRMLERATRTAGQLDLYREKFVQESGNRSGILLSKAVVEISQKQFQAIRGYSSEVQKIMGQAQNEAGVKNARERLGSL